MPDRTAREFWTFSLAVYDQPGVATACLALQERHGLDVNLLLFCCWAGVRGAALTAAQIKLLRRAGAAWSGEVVQPLRAVRRRLKSERDDEAQDLRAKVLQLEIEAERLEQARLLAALPLPAGEPEPRKAGANLQAYLRSRKVTTTETEVAELACLLGACFPDLPPLLAVWFLLP